MATAKMKSKMVAASALGMKGVNVIPKKATPGFGALGNPAGGGKKGPQANLMAAAMSMSMLKTKVGTKKNS